MLTVQKFGGSSLADIEKLRRAARIILDARHREHDVVAVVSAMGDTTDDLVDLAHEIDPNPSARELDALMSTGEQQSAALLAIMLESMGAKAQSLTGWQAGMYTDTRHGDAGLELTFPSRVAAALRADHIPVVAGFQGIDVRGDISTLGRAARTRAQSCLPRLWRRSAAKYTPTSAAYTPRIRA